MDALHFVDRLHGRQAVARGALATDRSRVMRLMVALATLAAGTLLLIRPATAADADSAKATNTANAAATACPATLNYTIPRLQDEAPQALCQYSGRVVLIVNTASYCGFTKQYEQLEALHARFAARGLVVMGFPSNDFGGQEPGTKEQIADLCFNTYGVKFPMFSKITVVGPNAHPLYAGLAKASGQAPRWNFHKYLLDRNGRVVASFPSQVTPLDPALVRQIEALLTDGATKSARS